MYNEKTIEKLKQKILDLAIRGKLVPQDPNDEPASVLIEKIRKEKEKLIKEGKIKKPKEESFIFKGSDNLYYENVNGKVKCIQDEIPFEIPESWVWCRLGNIFNVIMGQSPLGNSISEFIDGIEFHQGKLFFGNKYLKNSNAKTTMPTKISNENSVLLCIRAPVGKVNINKRKICIGRGLCSIEHNKYFLYELLYYFLLNFEQYFIYKSTGSTFKSITNEVVMNLILPIPPLKEQNNIVIKCNELLDLIDNIQKEYDNTNKIKKSLKNKLLDFIFSPNSSYKSYYENEFNLGDILEYEQPGPYIVNNTDYNDNFDIPVLTPGKTFILGYTDEKDGIYKATKDNKVIIFDDFTTASRLVDFNFKVKSSAMKILHISDESKFDIEYMYYLLQTINIIVDTHKRFWISEYAPLKVRIHTYDEQIRIKNKIKSVFETINNL